MVLFLNDSFNGSALGSNSVSKHICSINLAMLSLVNLSDKICKIFGSFLQDNALFLLKIIRILQKVQVMKILDYSSQRFLICSFFLQEMSVK